MNTLTALKLFVVIMLIPAISFSQKTRNCGTMENLAFLTQNDPNLAENMERIETHTSQWIAANNSAGKAVITIPVVVHVVYKTSAQNISDAQIQSQINVLTQDFRRANADASNTPSFFAGIAADVQIEFCLAVRDPNGNASTGITRTQTSSSSFSNNNYVKYNNYGGKNAWPASAYLNLWVCNLSGNTLGYGQFPGGSAATDGVVISYRYFGSGGSAQYPFNKGRTATHEVGHWLNLRHIWGDSYCGNDYVSDTPTQKEDNAGCPSFPRSTCGNSSDMFMNYMDYTNDACMNMFSVGQSSRMNALFGNGGSRASLKNSLGCTPVGNVSAYCLSKGNSVADEWIDWVKLGSIYNNSGADGGYADFTSISTDLIQGDSYTLSLKPGFASTTYNEYWKIWIDYNQDDDFSDAGELVYDAGSLSNTTVSGSFVVSSTSLPGDTRMRISMKYNAAQTSACETFNYGEVEDYTVTLIAVCPLPTGLNASIVTTSSATLNWNSTTATSYNVRIKAVSSSTWNDFVTTGTSFNITGMTSATDYEFQVKSVCTQSNTSAFTVSSTFTTVGNNSVSYCPSNGKEVGYEWIASVTVGDLTNSSGANDGYADFSNLTGTMEQSGTYDVTLVPGFASQSYNEFWRIWIDLNQDGDFVDAGEMIFNPSASSITISGTITIPTSATLGETRMRVSMKYNANPSSCGQFSYGEVEDYTVAIIPPAPVLSYCSSAGSDASYEWIAGVAVGGINNTSGTDGGYADNTSITTDLDIGIVYNITLTPGFASTVYNEYWKIWIDLNQNGDFEDVGELVYDQGGMSSSTVTGTIDLPNTSTLGSTTMRVSMKYNAASAPCESFNYGEVEDYSINIVDNLKISDIDEEAAAELEMNMYPNPTTGNAYISISSDVSDDDLNIVVSNVQGQVMIVDKVSSSTMRYVLATDDYAPGTYFVMLSTGSLTTVKRLVVIK